MNTATEKRANITVYVEANPNPASLKFVTNYMLVPDGTDYDYTTESNLAAAPLAQAIFDTGLAERVFLMSNFVTITKRKELPWD